MQGLRIVSPSCFYIYFIGNSSQNFVECQSNFSVEVKDRILRSDDGCMMKIVNEELEKKVLFL